MNIGKNKRKRMRERERERERERKKKNHMLSWLVSTSLTSSNLVDNWCLPKDQ